MSNKQNDIFYENLEEIKADKYTGKKLCKECGERYHPEEYPTCFECYSKQPSKVLGHFK